MSSLDHIRSFQILQTISSCCQRLSHRSSQSVKSAVKSATHQISQSVPPSLRISTACHQQHCICTNPSPSHPPPTSSSNQSNQSNQSAFSKPENHVAHAARDARPVCDIMPALASASLLAILPRDHDRLPPFPRHRSCISLHACCRPVMHLPKCVAPSADIIPPRLLFHQPGSPSLFYARPFSILVMVPPLRKLWLIVVV